MKIGTRGRLSVHNSQSRSEHYHCKHDMDCIPQVGYHPWKDTSYASWRVTPLTCSDVRHHLLVPTPQNTSHKKLSFLPQISCAALSKFFSYSISIIQITDNIHITDDSCWLILFWLCSLSLIVHAWRESKDKPTSSAVEENLSGTSNTTINHVLPKKKSIRTV